MSARRQSLFKIVAQQAANAFNEHADDDSERQKLSYWSTALDGIEHLDRYQPRLAKGLNNLANLFFYVGLLIKAVRYIPFHPIPVLANAIVQGCNLLGYIFWRAALKLDKQNLLIKENHLGQNVQQSLTAIGWLQYTTALGIIAAFTVGLAMLAISGAASTILLAIGACIYALSSFCWSQGMQQKFSSVDKNMNPQLIEPQLRANSLYRRYASNMFITNSIIAIGTVVAICMPPLAPLITIIASLVAALPGIKAVIARIQYQKQKYDIESLATKLNATKEIELSTIESTSEELDHQHKQAVNFDYVPDNAKKCDRSLSKIYQQQRTKSAESTATAQTSPILSAAHPNKNQRQRR